MCLPIHSLQALQMLPNSAKFEDFCSNFLILTEHLQSPKRHPMLSMQQSCTFFLHFLVSDGICVVAFTSVLW